MAVICVPYKNDKFTKMYEEKIAGDYLLYLIHVNEERPVLHWTFTAGESDQKINDRFRNLQAYYKNHHGKNTKSQADFYFRTRNDFTDKINKEKKQRPLLKLNEDTMSIFLGIYLNAVLQKNNKQFNGYWDLICVTGNLKYDVDNNILTLVPVSNIDKKYHGEFEAEANKIGERKDKEKCLFLYISDKMEESIPPDDGKEHGTYKNITVKWFNNKSTIDDIIKFLFKPSSAKNKNDELQKKQREEEVSFNNHIKCTFNFDNTYRLDHEISSKDEISDIYQAFQSGYKITALNGLPGCGKTYIARSFANKYRDQYPVVKMVRLKRVSDEQSLASLVISSLRFDRGIGNTDSPEDQFNEKLDAFNKVALNKLIIISGVSDINRDDIESLLELNTSFILCMEKNVSHPDIKPIRVRNILYDDAVKLFRHYNKMDTQDEILKDIFEMIEYHIGTIIFMAKLMQQNALSISDVRDKLNTHEIGEMPTDTGIEIKTLAEYLKALFSFDSMLNEEVVLLTLLSLLPTKNHDIVFLEKNFECAKLKFRNALAHLGKKGYITHDVYTQSVKCPFLVGKAFLESGLFDIDIVKSVLSDIHRILDYEDCNEYSVIEEKVKFGVVAVEKLTAINAFDDADLCLKIANGFKDLCFVDDAQRYAEKALELRGDKTTTLHVMHFKVDIMIFRFDYRHSVEYLEAQINQVAWENFSGKEKGEILYKIGLTYNFLRLFDKASEYFKRGFYAFKEGECIVGEFVCIAALLRSIDKKYFEEELKLFVEDGNNLSEVDPFWSFIGYTLCTPIGDLLIESKLNLRNISLDKLIDTMGGMDESQGESFINELEENLKRIKNKANEGGTLEQAVCNFFETARGAVESFFYGDKEFDANIVLESIFVYLCEVLNKLREVNIPLRTEIDMLLMLNGGFIKEMKLINDSLLEAKVLHLFEQRYNNLLPTRSEKLLATKSYVQVLPPKNAVLELEQQIEVLKNHLPQESRYPLVGFYEDLACRYNDFYEATKDASYIDKCKKNVLNAIEILRTVPDMAEKQANLFCFIGDYDSAIDIDPSYIVAYIRRGNAYYSKGDYDNAIEDYTKALEIDPSYTVVYYNRGNAYYSKEDYDSAIEDYTKVLEIDPSNTVVYNSRGNAYYRKGDYDNAIENYTKALEIDPFYEVAYNNQGNAYRAKRDNDHFVENYIEEESDKMDKQEKFSLIIDGDSKQPMTSSNLAVFFQKKIWVKEITPSKYAIAYPMQKVSGGLYNIYLIVGDDNLYLSDEGTTIEELDKIFELGEPDVIKNLVAIMKQYGCKKEGKNITIECSPNDIHIKISFLIQAISFMLNMKIFYI